MKTLRLFYAFLFLLGATNLMAQNSNLIVYTGENEDFTLWINGFKINNVPSQHVRVTGLKPSQYTVEAVFQDLHTLHMQCTPQVLAHWSPYQAKKIPCFRC